MFNQNGTDRDFKLGTKRKWAVGLLDMSMGGSMPFQFSDEMEMLLDNDAPKAVRDMADREDSKPGMDMFDTILDVFTRPVFGDAIMDLFNSVNEQEKINDRRRRSGKKMTDAEMDRQTREAIKNVDNFFDSMFNELFDPTTKKMIKDRPSIFKDPKKEKEKVVKKAEAKTFGDLIEDFFGIFG